MDLHLKKHMYGMRTSYKIIAIAALSLAVFIFGSATIRKDCPAVASVRLERMNVVFSGVDNPVTISVSGIDPKFLDIFIIGASMHPQSTPGQFIIRVSQGSKIKLDVGYRKGGVRVSSGTFEYRVKKIPDPVAYVNDIRHEGMMQKADLQTLTGVFTRMENFDFDYAFKPESFSMSVIENGVWKEYTAQGPAITQEMKTALNNAKPEEKIIFHSIMTKGPDSAVRKVNDVVITVK